MPRIDARFVILNVVKNPLQADKQQRTQRIAREEILRVAQDDILSAWLIPRLAMMEIAPCNGV